MPSVMRRRCDDPRRGSRDNYKGTSAWRCGSVRALRGRSVKVSRRSECDRQGGRQADVVVFHTFVRPVDVDDDAKDKQARAIMFVQCSTGLWLWAPLMTSPCVKSTSAAPSPSSDDLMVQEIYSERCKNRLPEGSTYKNLYYMDNLFASSFGYEVIVECSLLQRKLK